MEKKASPIVFDLGINGMGRIGRTLFRVLHEQGALHRLKAVNDIMPKENLLYLLKYDTVHGLFSSEIKSTHEGFEVDDVKIKYHQQQDIVTIPWAESGVEAVVEATGIFTRSEEAILHLNSGVKKVLLTTYSKDLPTMVWGVNEKKSSSPVISPGDCTINCTAPIINVIENNFGIHSVHINVVQGYTSRQQLVDSPYKGLRRGRAAAHSIIPFEVNISPVLEQVFPPLIGKIKSMSARVPVPCGAMADITFMLKKNTDSSSVNDLLLRSSQDQLKGIISLTFDPIVSADIIKNPHSSVVDGLLTSVVAGNHMKLILWFDNEWGYANRLYDWLTII